MRQCLVKMAAGILVAVWCLTGQEPCAGSEYVPCRPGNGGDLAANADSALVVTIDTAQKRQTIGGFGASDAWSIQFVGQWPDTTRQDIADLLFETGLNAFNEPKGIGLSGWRFNVGAGSSRQTDISDSWRRADTFLDENFAGYDWSRCPGQRWFLQAAKARGVERFTAFANSPPINMTKTGLAYCRSTSGRTNLRQDCVSDFAVYLATILEHFKDVEGIEFDAISPFNEPNWEWNDAGQEGCRYYNSDIKQVVTALYQELQSRQLSTEIEICDAGDIGYLYGYSGQRGDYIDAFFSPSSAHYVGDRVAQRITSHSYNTCWPEDDRLVGWRQTLRDKLDHYPGLDYAMTEYCILVPSNSSVPSMYRDYGNGRDLGMDPALWIARVIHHDLVIAGASSWYWWLAVSPYDYKDGLVYIDKRTTQGQYYESKMLWAMGNFSRFVRPGMVRLDVRRSDNARPRDTIKDLMVSAYYDVENDVAVAVFVNCANDDRCVRFDFRGTRVRSLIPYVTRGDSSDADNLTAYRALSPDDTVTIPARSVVTVVGMPTNRGDHDHDGKTDFRDFVLLASQWLETNCLKFPGTCRADLRDVAAFADHWLRDNRLVAYWTLDETVGSVAHDRGGPHDAVLHGDPSWCPEAGHARGALEFDGADDYVATPIVLNPADAPFSAFAWVQGGGPGQVVLSQACGATGLPSAAQAS